MQITLVEVLNRRVDPATRDDCADVVFHSGNVITRLVAKAPRASPGSELVKDALRQLLRMPEFRSGSQALDVLGEIFSTETEQDVLRLLHFPPVRYSQPI